MRLKLIAVAAVSFTTASVAQAPAPPKLLVVISVDQFSADLFDEYRPQYRNGLARLASGAAFHNGYQSHAATETCPGHSTILTGDHPYRTGIIANSWYDPSVSRPDKMVYCAEDETVPGSSSKDYTVSPKHLVVPTLGELMKRVRPASRSVAVSGKDRAAVMMTGHVVDQRWFWNGKTFATDQKGAPVPQTVGRVNAAVAAALTQPRPPLEPPPFCQAKAGPIAVENSSKVVGTGRFARPAGDATALRASPELDGDTLALAAGLVDEMRLGHGPAPDLLAISLSATDYIGHGYGTEGEEMCLQMLELDREIGDFLSVLDDRGVDYEVALTADHGGLDIPERARTAGEPQAKRVSASLYPAKMGAALVQKLGLTGPGLIGDSPFGDIYIDKNLSPRDQARLLAAAVAAYSADPDVQAVFTAQQIAATPVPTSPPTQWSLIQRLRASYYPRRSGDFLVVGKPRVTPIADTSHSVATHGSPWDYDRRVPILFWRKGAPAVNSEAPVETTDILPTLASMIRVPVAAGSIDGHCLSAVAGTNCPAR
jgi:predicted AlkP superfamily pyrophosphatase or phosphodiesterase